MPYRYFPIEFSSYEDYIKYLKEKGFAIEVEENNPIKNKVMTKYIDTELIDTVLNKFHEYIKLK